MHAGAAWRLRVQAPGGRLACLIYVSLGGWGRLKTKLLVSAKASFIFLYLIFYLGIFTEIQPSK